MEIEHGTLKYRARLSRLSGTIHSHLSDLEELINLTEHSLKKETILLEERVAKEINKLSSEEDKEFAIGWYADDFVRLDRVYPIIQRRSLFITLMCMLEADLLFTCQMCQKAFKLPKEFEKKGNVRMIVQALNYIKKNLVIQDKRINKQWEFLQTFWTIRNALVHNDGKPRTTEEEKISLFCSHVPTLELDRHKRIILKEGSVQIALFYVKQFFTRICEEIHKNKLPD